MGMLLIDSSSKKTEFGFSKDNKIVLEKTLPDESNADTLTFYIKESLDKMNISFSEIKFVCISNGPGSFTGLRIGSAIAKGICFATGCRLIELPSLDVIANKAKTEKNVTALIFSNMRTLEFYYCKYVFDNKMKRITEYSTAGLEHILTDPDSEFVINETVDLLPEKVKDVAGFSTIRSMNELAIEYIRENRFSDYMTSEPFYMKDFLPKKN